MNEGRGDPDPETLLAAAVLGFTIGVALGVALGSRRGRRGREVRRLVDELVLAARDGLLTPRGAGPRLDEAVRRLRRLGEAVRTGGAR